MIFVTVGTDLPFDRLTRIVDQWAKENARTDLFAQIGEGGEPPSFMPFRRFLEPAEFSERFAASSLIIAHAGMGTILSALHYGKPILVMPRRASLGEQRNEHQLATAQRMLEMGNVSVAFDENELREKLIKLDEIKAKDKIPQFASHSLIAEVRQFIHGCAAPGSSLR